MAVSAVLEKVDSLISGFDLTSFLFFVGLPLIVTLIGSRITQWLRLRHFAGPPLAGFSRLFWRVPHARHNQKHLRLTQVNQKYGSIARIGPNMLLTSDWKLWKSVTKASHFTGFRQNPTRDHVACTIDENEHSRLRNMMIHGYSGKEVEGVESKLDTNILSLVHLLESRYISQNKPFDFGRKAQYFTTDVISHLAYGAPFGFLATDSDVYNYIQTMESYFPFASISTVFPGIIKLMNWPVLKRFAPSAEDKTGLGRLMGLAKKTAAERFGPNRKVEKDMLGSFVARGLTQVEAEAEILLQILAGSDTSATTIRVAMLFIATNPRVLRKLQAEIDSVAPSLGASDVISDETVRNLPYLSAVVKEALRVYPPAIDHAPRVVPPEGDEWNGMVLPGGTDLGWNPWAICHDTEVFGDDADCFRPDRWLGPDLDEGKRGDMETVGDMVFGGGRFQCLGRSIALIETRKIIFELFRRYEFEVLHPDKPWESFGWGIFEQHEFWVKAHLRDATGK